MPSPTLAETFPLPCQLLCLRDASVEGVITLSFPLKSEDSGSSINGMSTLTRQLSELYSEELALLSAVLLDEFPISTFIDVVRESGNLVPRLPFFLFLSPCFGRVLSSIEPILPSEGSDAASLCVVSSFLGFAFLAHSSN